MIFNETAMKTMIFNKTTINFNYFQLKFHRHRRRRRRRHRCLRRNRSSDLSLGPELTFDIAALYV